MHKAFLMPAFIRAICEIHGKVFGFPRKSRAMQAGAVTGGAFQQAFSGDDNDNLL